MTNDKHEQVLNNAFKYIGTHYDYPSYNAHIERWLNYCNLALKDDNGHYNEYCMAFVFGMLHEAGFDTPFCDFRGGMVLKTWEKTPSSMKVAEPYRGCIFFMNHGGGKGHTGFVANVSDCKQYIITIEGNTSNLSNISRSNVHEIDFDRIFDQDRTGGWVMSKVRLFERKKMLLSGIDLVGFADPYLIK